MTKFEKELIALLKKHKKNSLNTKWNNPAVVKAYEVDVEAYAARLKKFLEENPEPRKVAGTYDKWPDTPIKVRDGYYVATAEDAVDARIRDAWEDNKYKLNEPLPCDYDLVRYSEYNDEVPSGFWRP